MHIQESEETEALSGDCRGRQEGALIDREVAEEYLRGEGAPWSRVVSVVILAWVLPGAGHLLLRRYGRALFFTMVILALFAGGLALDGKVYRPVSGEPLTYLASLGAFGVGGPYLGAWVGDFGHGDERAATFDYGNSFTLLAGLLNMLIVLDALDVVRGRR